MASLLVGTLVLLAVSGLPIVEMRLAIWLGLTEYSMPPVYVGAITIVGNLLIIAPAWFVLPHLETGLRRWRPMSRWLDWLFSKTRKETAKREKAEEFGLFVIVALTGLPVPIPGSGLYTALIAAY